jgi:hypothetical protein
MEAICHQATKRDGVELVSATLYRSAALFAAARRKAPLCRVGGAVPAAARRHFVSAPTPSDERRRAQLFVFCFA